MAQLHVQKKRNQSWWVWIIVILIIFAIVYYLLVRNDIVPDSLGLKKYYTSWIVVNDNLQLT
jgi:uncharacterized membrane protein YkvA (DUF1232 family)